MLGNVREFCADWYDPKYYKNEIFENPKGPDSGEKFVVRGGSYKSDAAELRIAARDFTKREDWQLTDPQMPKSIWWYSDCNDVGLRVVCEYNLK
jgi:formylglycine-generating enzyme required for sulfatase activity